MSGKESSYQFEEKQGGMILNWFKKNGERILFYSLILVAVIFLISAISSYYKNKEGYSRKKYKLKQSSPDETNKPLEKTQFSPLGAIVPLNCSNAQNITVTGNATFLSNGKQNGYLWSSANNPVHGLDKSLPSATVTFGGLPSFMSLNVTITVVGGGSGGAASDGKIGGVGGGGGSFVVFTTTIKPNTTLYIGFNGDENSGKGGQVEYSSDNKDFKLISPYVGAATFLNDISNGAELSYNNNIVYCYGGGILDEKQSDSTKGGVWGTFGGDGVGIPSSLATTPNVTDIQSIISGNGGDGQIPNLTPSIMQSLAGGLGGTSYMDSGVANQSFGIYGSGGAGGDISVGSVINVGPAPNVKPVKTKGFSSVENLGLAGIYNKRERFTTDTSLDSNVMEPLSLLGQHVGRKERFTVKTDLNKFGDSQSSLLDRIASDEKQVADLQNQVQTNEKLLNDLQSQLTKDESLIQSLTDQIANQTQMISDLNQQIANLQVQTPIPVDTPTPIPVDTPTPGPVETAIPYGPETPGPVIPTPQPGKDGAPAMVMIMWNLS